MYAVNSNGTLQRVFNTAKTIRSSPVIAGNRLYFGSADAKLYAFDLNQPAAASSWPMFHLNAARTGRIAATAVAISLQPQSRTLVDGAALTLSVTATGSGTLSYQWFKNGTALAGATRCVATLLGTGLERPASRRSATPVSHTSLTGSGRSTPGARLGCPHPMHSHATPHQCCHRRDRFPLMATPRGHGEHSP